MPGWKAVLLYGVAIAFDFLKFLFVTIVLAAPFLAGVAANYYLQGNGWPAWAAGFVGTVVGTAAAGVEVASAPVTSALEFFGVIMGSVAGFIGWLTIWTVLFFTGVNPFSAKHWGVTLPGFLASEVPFANLFPTLTPSVYFIIRTVRKEDKEALDAWKKTQQDEERRALAERQARIQQAQQAVEEPETI